MGERTDEIRVSTDLDREPLVVGESYDTSDKSSDQIAAEIEQTRDEMSTTVDAIQKKLSPDKLVDQVLDSLRDTLDRSSDQILYTLKQHPLMTALVGAGVGWLLLQSSGRSGVGQYAYEGSSQGPSYGSSLKERAGEAVGSLKDTAASAQDKASEWAASAKDQAAHLAGQAREQISHLAGQAREQAGHIAGQAREQAGYLASRASDQASRMGSMARNQARHTAERFGNAFQEYPLAMAAVGLALGAAIGLLIPETRREEELMGETRDNLLDKAKETASDTMDRVQRVAEAAKDAVKDEVNRQDLKGDARSAKDSAVELGKTLIDKAENVVRSATEAAKDEAQKQGLTPENLSAKVSSTVEATKGQAETGEFTPGESSGTTTTGSDLRYEETGDTSRRS